MLKTSKRYNDRFQATLRLEAEGSSDDFSGQRVLVGVSGGINSAALLVHLLTEHPVEKRPKTLMLFAALLKEHPPGVERRGVNEFALDMMRWARARHPDVRLGVHRASVLAFFESEKFIPHPTLSPCTAALKLVPMARWSDSQGGHNVDLVGYVRGEQKRIDRQQARGAVGKRYPIAHITNADCFALVREHIGYYPEVYDLTEEDGKPSFGNGNCIPCKNWGKKRIESGRRHYPGMMRRADDMAARIGAYWGRETTHAPDACAVCAFD